MNLITKLRSVQVTYPNGKIVVVKLTDNQIANVVKSANKPKIYILG